MTWHDIHTKQMTIKRILSGRVGLDRTEAEEVFEVLWERGREKKNQLFLFYDMTFEQFSYMNLIISLFNDKQGLALSYDDVWIHKTNLHEFHHVDIKYCLCKNVNFFHFFLN